MKYVEAIDLMLNDASWGFTTIQASPANYKEGLKAEVTRAQCSITTAKVFLGFVEEKLKSGEAVRFDSTMGEAAMFIGNGLGLDPTNYSAVIRQEDLLELRAVANFRG